MFTFQTLSSSLGLSVIKAPKDGIRTRNQRGRSLVWKSPWLESTASLLSSLLLPNLLFLLSSLRDIPGLDNIQPNPLYGSWPAPVTTSYSSPEKQPPKHAQSSEFLCKTKQNLPKAHKHLNASLAFGTRLCFVLPLLPLSLCSLLFMPFFFLMSWIFFFLKKSISSDK